MRRQRSRPAIDLGVLDEHLGYFVRRLQVWIFQDFIRRLSRIDISPAQFSVLVVIGANAGLSQAELAATLGIERARLVRLLHRLERRGLTQRLPSSADGRRHALAADARRAERCWRGPRRWPPSTKPALKQKLGAERYRVLLGDAAGVLRRSLPRYETFSTAAAMRNSRRSWPLRATSIRPVGRPPSRGSGSEMAQRSKKLTMVGVAQQQRVARHEGLRLGHLVERGATIGVVGMTSTSRSASRASMARIRPARARMASI